jgi:hypothetical protein
VVKETFSLGFVNLSWGLEYGIDESAAVIETFSLGFVNLSWGLEY